MVAMSVEEGNNKIGGHEQQTNDGSDHKTVVNEQTTNSVGDRIVVPGVVHNGTITKSVKVSFVKNLIRNFSFLKEFP